MGAGAYGKGHQGHLLSLLLSLPAHAFAARADGAPESGQPLEAAALYWTPIGRIGIEKGT